MSKWIAVSVGFPLVKMHLSTFFAEVRHFALVLPKLKCRVSTSIAILGDVVDYVESRYQADGL